MVSIKGDASGAETAAPDSEKSITRQEVVERSPISIVAIGLRGTTRA